MMGTKNLLDTPSLGVYLAGIPVHLYEENGVGILREATGTSGVDHFHGIVIHQLERSRHNPFRHNGRYRRHSLGQTAKHPE
ncbi:MAG: hypothetical protein BWY79_01697 [Actinobacteria bacterium ADurb.Bin444]|nr:MAG: hypothetical protein BWY79_01697 [Actinobacteria bacterium ADurb.Bin444]